MIHYFLGKLNFLFQHTGRKTMLNEGWAEKKEVAPLMPEKYNHQIVILLYIYNANCGEDP